MNNIELMDAVGGIDRGFIEEHMKKKEKLARTRRARRAFMKYGAVAAAAVIVLLAVGAMSPQITGSMTIGGFFDQVFRPGGNVTVNEVTTEEVLEAPWERLNMALGVKNGLIRAGSYNTKIAMTVRYADTSIPDDFMYEGKSYSEYVAERDALRARNEELQAQEQTDGVKEEIAQNKKKIVEIADCITSAANAYKIKCAEEIYKLFEEKGCQVIRTGAILHLRASYRELSKLVIEGSETLYFDVGYESVFLKEEESETSDAKTEGTLNENAYFKKFQRNNSVKTDIKNERELKELIEYLLEKYETNNIEFIFGCASSVDMGLFENMNYFTITHSRFYMTMRVLEKDINIDALIELAKRKDIGVIYIEPAWAVLDGEITDQNGGESQNDAKAYLKKIKTIPDIDFELKEDKDFDELIEILYQKSETNCIEIVLCYIRDDGLVYNSTIIPKDKLYFNDFMELAKRQDIYSIYIEPR